MPLPNVSSTPRQEIPQGTRDFALQFPGGEEVLRKAQFSIDQRKAVAGSDLALELKGNFQDIIDQGGVGLSEEQLDVQFRGIEQQLQPQFNTQLQRIDEQASRRGVFRSGIPLAQSQKTQRQQAQQLGNIRTQLTTENERQKNQTLLTALGALQALESDMANRILYLQALDQLKQSQDQAGYQELLGQFGTFALNAIFPGAGTAAGALLPGISPGAPNAPFPTTGGIT